MSANVLVVDDSSTVRQQVRMALQQAGFTVIEAVDGQDGLAKAKADAKVIGLVISDVNMPRMNGLQMLEAIKADPTTRHLPVVMLTSEGQPALVKRAKSLGAKGWIVKPFKAAMLVAAAKKLSALGV